MAQKSLRDLIHVLDENGKLLRVAVQIVKETELIPFVKFQFRGLPEDERDSFFGNVVSVTGKKDDASVAVACFAGSLLRF